MHRNHAKQIALGGVMGALAVIIMCLGGLIPASTFVCPMLCCLMVHMVRHLTGSRIAWAWYGAVAILAVLMGPDKEAAAVFVFLGYYPILKPKFDRLPLRWLWKGIYFNAVILLMYALLIHLFGMAELAAEWKEIGFIMTVVMLLCGNVAFFLLDQVLARRRARR